MAFEDRREMVEWVRWMREVPEAATEELIRQAEQWGDM